MICLQSAVVFQYVHAGHDCRCQPVAGWVRGVTELALPRFSHQRVGKQTRQKGWKTATHYFCDSPSYVSIVPVLFVL